MSLSSAGDVVAQDQVTGFPVTVTISRPSGDSANVSLTVTGVPACATTLVTNPGSGNTGKLLFSTLACSAAGTYSATIQASDGTTTATSSYALTVPVVVSVAGSALPQGTLDQFMSTSFQPASWNYEFFRNHPDTTALNNLGPHHIRLQPVEIGVPQKTDKTWDFSTLNAILEPAASVTDRSPELQLATAPGWMCDSNGHLLPPHFGDFAAYASQLVEYYNTHTGFTDSSGTHVHASYTPITYWGVFNEPNYNGLSPDQYVTLYNLVVPAMQSARSDVQIKIVGLELGDSFDSTHQAYIDAFARDATAQTDIVATHFYSSCNQSDTDESVMTSVTNNFVPELQYLLAAKAASPNRSIASAPVWVTENNVNADYSAANGLSACNPNQQFVTDKRGTSAFFAAWRPYVYSQFGKLGVGALYHWDYDADQQYGEVDFTTGNKYLSYWVDLYLQQYFCGTNAAGCDQQELLQADTSEATSSQSVEVLATRQSDSSVTVMVANHAVANPTDNNGTGEPRTVIVNLSGSLGGFSAATQLMLDSSTEATAGPAATSVSGMSGRYSVALNGYGVTFLHFTPAPAAGIGPASRPHIAVPGHSSLRLRGAVRNDASTTPKNQGGYPERIF